MWLVTPYFFASAGGQVIEDPLTYSFLIAEMISKGIFLHTPYAAHTCH